MTPPHSTLSAPALVTVLTDFGTSDYYVAAVKGTLLRLAPGSAVVDLSHGVPPGAIATGAFLLAAAATTFPTGTVHLAVVDPGVGSERRILAVDAGTAFFVGPDNGLLMPAVDRCPGARIYAVHRPDLYLDHDHDGHTFHGRDRFAPVAAALLREGKPDSLGSEIDDPVRLDLPQPRREGGCLTGRVVHIDRYGNLVTDLPSRWLERPFERAEVETGDGVRAVPRRVRHYARLAKGEAGVLPGSLGTEEISLPGESLATRWGITIGIQVRIYLR